MNQSTPFRPLPADQTAVFEANPHPVLILDGQFRIRYLNPASATVGAVDREQLLGEHIWTRYPAMRDSIFARAYEAVLQEGRATQFEDRSAGRERWRSVYAYPFDGGVIAIMSDVTAQRASEHALRESEEALARAQSLAAIGSWSFSTERGLQLSAEAYRLLGLDATTQHADVASIAARLHPTQRQQLSQAIAVASSREDVRVTVPYSRFDGKDITLDVVLRVIRLDGAQASQLYGTIQDISERIRASEELRRSEQMLRLAQEAASIGSFDRDLRTLETRWSKQLFRIVGLDRESESVERDASAPTESFVHPDDLDALRETYRRAISSGERQVIRNRIIRRDGAVRHLLSSAMLVRDAAGAPARLVGTAIDITEQVEAEAERLRLESQIQQAQKLESLGLLAGGIAHDFNNLLVGILGNASLALLDLDPSHAAHRSISSIEHAAQRAAELTRQLLAYAGKGRFVVEPVDASSVVHEMSALLRTAIARNATMQLDLAESLPAIDVDVTQFRQVVMNLITNASDALEERAGTITLRTHVRSLNASDIAAAVTGTNAAPGRFVCVEVTDTGTGMAAETIARVFDPFFSTKFTGRGLGLAATLGIVRSHRGAIQVNSALGHGTTFSLFFPTTDREATTARATKSSGWRGSGRILIVDDEASVRAVTSALLERRGFEVTTADDGHDALAKFEQAPDAFSLVLLDLTMPGLDGHATLNALRAIRAETRVLLMSGYNEQEVTRLFVGKGLAGFLQKPFRADDLYEKVAATLGIS